jgi:copper transport protein
LVVGIDGELVAGDYQVVWQTAGGDGHPVRGRFEFTITETAMGAAGESVPSAGSADSQAGNGAATSATPGIMRPSDAEYPTSPDPTGMRVFGVESPLYAMVRLLVFVGILGVVGVSAFRLLVVERVVRAERGYGPLLAESIGAAPARLGLAFVGLLGLAVVLRPIAQGYALGGGDFDGRGLRLLLMGTIWGWGWIAQVLAAAVAGLGFLWASRGRAGGWAMAGAAALLLALTPGLSGHAVGVPRGMPMAILADAGHVLGAGGWLGGLLALLGIGVPAALRLEEEARGAAVAGLVHAFSALALSCAALVIVTGGLGAWMHLGALPALWQTGYGRALLVKFGVLSLVFGAGAYNYLRVRPVVGSSMGTRRLRRSALLELAVGVVVLIVTAVLVAMPTPRFELNGAGEPAAAEAPSMVGDAR